MDIFENRFIQINEGGEKVLLPPCLSCGAKSTEKAGPIFDEKPVSAHKGNRVRIFCRSCGLSTKWYESGEGYWAAYWNAFQRWQVGACRGGKACPYSEKLFYLEELESQVQAIRAEVEKIAVPEWGLPIRERRLRALIEIRTILKLQ